MRLKRTALNIFTIFILLFMLTPLAVSTGTVYAGQQGGGQGGQGGGQGGQGGQQGGGSNPTCGSTDTAKGQVLKGIGLTGGDCDDKQVDNTFKTIVQIISILVGITSVIVILISGFKYMASGGEAQKVSNAKNSLLYALVGLAVAGLAQWLIHFVLFQTNKV